MDIFQEDGLSGAEVNCRQSPMTYYHNSSSEEDLRAFNTIKLFQILRTKCSEAKIIEKLKTCLKAGADINACNGRGNTVLRIAKKKNYHAVTKFLLRQDGVVSEENIPATQYIDIDEGFTTPPLTEFIVDPDLKLSCPHYIESLKTKTKDSDSINDKLNLDPYPSDHTLALLALKVYSDNPDDETQQKLPDGWELLTTARNLSWTNGYFGAAFWCRDLLQVVVAHRGTAVMNTGAMWTNVKGIIWNKETSHICSAITFTDAIATALNKVKEGSFQLSITGHSLGGWLAQITAFTVKYLQKDKSTFRKIINIKDGFHARTVVFDSPGCRSMLSTMKDKFDLRYERSIFLRRLDISSYLSAPNRINCLNLHLGIIYRVMTDLSDINVLDEYTLGYTTKTHSMKKILEALETPDIVEMLDWPLRSVLRGLEYNQFFKGTSHEKIFHQQADRYEFKGIDRNSCSLRIFSEDELLLLDSWMILKKSKMNLTNLIKIKSLAVNDLFDNFVIDKEKQIVTCSSEESIQKVIRHTKALMRWLPAEVMAATREQAALVPSAAEAMFRAERDNYLRSLKQSQMDFRDTLDLESFLTSGSNILIIRTPDIDIEMMRFVNIFHQIKKKWDLPEETNNHYSFMDLKGIKRLESAVNIQELFQSCLTEDYLFILQCTEYYDKNFEIILNEILTNLKNNPNNKLVFVDSQDTDFEDLVKSFYLSLEIDNNLILKHTGEIKLNDLSEGSMKTLFEQKIILLHGERFSLREFVGEYRHLTTGQLDNVNKLIGPQMLKNLLTTENYVVEIEDTLLNYNDLKVHSTLNTEVSVARVAQILWKHSPDALLVVISGISREELETDGWRELVHGLGEDRIFTTTGDGESIFRKKCREDPSATIYWFSASAGLVHCNTIYKKEFYIERKFVILKYIFDFGKFVQLTNKDSNITDIFVCQNVKDKQFLNSRWPICEDNKNIFFKSDQIVTAASAEEVDDIIKENPDRAVHILRQEANGGLIQWQRSRGTLEGLRPCVNIDIGESIDEAELCNTNHKVIIIADEPGMGKSTSLTSMSRLLRSAWVIRVDLKDFQIPTQILPTQLSLSLVCELILRDKDSWLRGLLQFCLDKEHENSRDIYIFFDGFDEIKQNSSPTKNCAEDEVLRLLKYLNNETTARVWVTTRLYRKEMLENAFSDFALQFERINESQQREYLVKFWRSHLLLELDKYGDAEERKLEECAESLYKNAKKVLGDDIQKFMGIPLQMRMLAEVYMQRVKVCVESETDIGNTFDVKSVLDLYQQFSSLKYEIYFSDKTGLNAGLSGEMKHYNVELMTDKHRLLGLRTLFPEFTKEHFDEPEDGWGAELCRVGLVQSGGDGSENIEFIHRTLAEYYCADLTVDWLNKKGRYHGHAPMIELLLTEMLLQDSHNVVRIFINNLLLSRPRSKDVDKFIAFKIIELCHKKVFFFNQGKQTALHAAVLERNSGIIDILLGSFKCEPVQLIDFIAAGNRGGDTALGLAAWMADDHASNKIMKKMVQSIETCPYEVTLGLLLATYIRSASVYAHQIKLLSDYLKRETDCLQIRNAFIRTTKIIQEDIPPFLAAVREGRAGDVDEIYGKMENDTERYYMLLAPNGLGDTALHLAARGKHNEKHQKMQTIRHLCNHNIPEVGMLYNNGGMTPLHLAAAAGHRDIVEHLISHVVYIDSLSSLHGETALFYAARSGSLPVVEHLVKKGSDVNIINKGGENVLFSAASGKSLSVMKCLVENGSDINIVNNNSENVLFTAASSESLPIIEFLVEKGSEINILNKDGENVLFAAARSKNPAVVEYLAEKGSDINILNKDGENILFTAVHSKSLPMIKYLVNKGSDINIINKDGENVLFTAVRSKSLLAVKYLVEKGSDINILNKDVENVLFTTVSSESLLMMEYLIDKGSDINIVNKVGENVLFTAARTKNLAVVEYLAEKGSDINILNKDGENVLFTAVCSKSLLVVEYLAEKGSDINTVNKYGETVLNYVDERMNQPLYEFLTEKLSPHVV